MTENATSGCHIIGYFSKVTTHFFCVTAVVCCRFYVFHCGIFVSHLWQTCEALQAWYEGGGMGVKKSFGE